MATAGALRAATDLASVIQPCFGPNGLCVLLEASDGHSGITSSGLQLSQSILFSHPANGYAGILITRAVKEHHSISGDGSKKMLLILAESLREVHNHCPSQSDSLKFHFEVSQALHQLQSASLHNDIIPSLRSKEVTRLTRLTNFDDIKSVSCQLLGTCFGNQYNYHIKKKLTDLVSTLVFPANTKNVMAMQKNLQLCIGNLDSMTVHAPGTPVTDSQVCPGFLIDRDFINPPEDLQGLRNFRMLLVLSGVGWEEADSTPTKFSLESYVQQTFDFLPQLLERIVQRISREGIQLVLCGGRVTPVAAQLFRANKILVVQMVPEDTLLSIAECSSTYPLSDSTSLASMTAEAHWQQGVYCKYLTVGQRRFIHLLVDGASPCSILLCAPTTGFCRQLARTIRNSLRVLHSWCHKDDEGGEECLLAVAGGGAWEIALIRQLEKYISMGGVVRGNALWVAVKAIQKGLFAVPHTLYTGSQPLAHARKTAAEFYCRVFSPGADVPYLGVDCIRGCLKAVGNDWPVWEPYSSQNALLYSVVALLSQLLRTDKMMATSRSVQSTIQEENVDTDTDSEP